MVIEGENVMNKGMLQLRLNVRMRRFEVIELQGHVEADLS